MGPLRVFVLYAKQYMNENKIKFLGDVTVRQLKKVLASLTSKDLFLKISFI